VKVVSNKVFAKSKVLMRLLRMCYEEVTDELLLMRLLQVKLPDYTQCNQV